jgi:hypothetical protein
MDSHFQNHLKPILAAAGAKAGRTLQYIHIDSWEAKGQNWTAGFAEEFQKRRGYAIRPWLPVLTGIPVQNAQMTNRFLWDMRLTVSELMLDNYIDRLRELSAPYGVKFSSESYGHFCVDNLTYGGRAEFPIAAAAAMTFTSSPTVGWKRSSDVASFESPERHPSFGTRRPAKSSHFPTQSKPTV